MVRSSGFFFPFFYIAALPLRAFCPFSKVRNSELLEFIPHFSFITVRVFTVVHMYVWGDMNGKKEGQCVGGMRKRF